MIRQPIIVVMGHVDHGKTSLLDRIRSTTITSREAGGITQHIGASEVPIEIVRETCGELVKRFNISLTIPGLLFIDTPGHEAFTNLRKRGGSVADLAILVVDITKEFEPQTYESIEILKEYKTPFILAANKIDLITGWKNTGDSSFLDAIQKQNMNVANELEAKVYTLVGRLSESGFESERFDRVKDFKKEVMIVPLSAKTGEGIAELLLYASGLSQRFLEMRLQIEVNGAGIGSIIEKKEERGLGTTIDVILFNGTLKVNDTVAFATSTGIGTAKIKALLKPKPLQELRESSSKFFYLDSVSAASGIKISGSGLDDALPGSMVISTERAGYESEIQSEIREIFSSDKSGVILKADTIGSIEAISRLLKSAGVSVSKKEVGNITKRDVLDAFAMRSVDPYGAVVMAFNVKADSDAETEAYATGVRIISGNIIYKLIDDYKEWAEQERKSEKLMLEKALTFPGELKVLPNSCFRISHPAIFGVEVMHGRIKPDVRLMNERGEILGRIKEIQDNGTGMAEAKKGANVAISIEDITFGRHVKESDLLYVFLNDENERALRYKFMDLIDDDERSLLERTSIVKQSAKKKK